MPDSPLANLLQILCAIALAGGAAYGWFRRRLRHSGALIARLQDDLARRTQQLDTSLKKNKELEENCIELMEHLPETTVANLNREIEDGNNNKAHDVVHNWLEREGEAISILLRFEVGWATEHATGDAHLAGLIVAEAFARAAHTIWPRDKDAAELSEELEKFCTATRLEDTPSFHEALATLANIDPSRLLGAHLVDYALELERTALTLEQENFYRLALLQIDRVVTILRGELGAGARPSLRARTTRVRLLIWAGRVHDALSEIQNITAVFARALGPTHPDSLASRFMLAQVLYSIGRTAEALSVIGDVATKQDASPELASRNS
jgi:hypothetical protein